MKIDDIKDPQIRALAWKYRKANKNEYLNKDTVNNGFDWSKTEEKSEFWRNVLNKTPVQITEKMKQDHPEIFLKQEEMKTTHTLENGTVLEVGKKYWKHHWDVIKSTEILYLGIEKAFFRTNKGYEYEQYYSQIQDLIPYEEPKEKIFENYKPYVHHMKASKMVQISFYTNRPYNQENHAFYTLEEAKELGLDLSIFNI